MTQSQQLLYTVHDSIATITINRPKVRNALNLEVRDGIRQRVAEFNKDPQARVLIITGSEDLAFSAGADLKEMSETGLRYPPKDFIPEFITDKPVIAAVNGIAWGGGFLLAQQADLVIAAEHATFGITEALYGRGSPWAAPLPLLIPPKVAMEIIVTAKPITSTRALEVGLVNSVVPLDQLSRRTLEMANLIVQNAPLTVAAGKKMLNAISSSLLKGLEQEIIDIWTPVYESKDAQEGPLAFLEKRKPEWKNC
jgi:enoyl-CoA hydratase/carnithine racemase